MRKRIVFLGLIAACLLVLLVLRSISSSREQSQPVNVQDNSSKSVGDGVVEVKATIAVQNAKHLGGIDFERKRKIVNAASACTRADAFRETIAAQTGSVSSKSLASLPEAQRRNYEEVERQCSSDPAARTAPADEFLVDLARGGNLVAASCYVSGGFRSRRHGVAPPDDPVYRQIVPELIERGVTAGDWSMVSMGAAANAPRQAGSAFTYLPAPKPELNFLYVKLLELGAIGQEKSDLKAVLVELAKNISPAEKKVADMKAEELFQAHFAKGPAYSHDNQSLCVNF